MSCWSFPPPIEPPPPPPPPVFPPQQPYTRSGWLPTALNYNCDRFGSSTIEIRPPYAQLKPQRGKVADSSSLSRNRSSSHSRDHDGGPSVKRSRSVSRENAKTVAKTTIHAYHNVFWKRSVPRINIVCYRDTQAVIQFGPTCGLVALQMAARLLGNDTAAVTDMLETGQYLSLTKQGEMFSAEGLAKLAETVLQIQSVKATVHEDILANKKLIIHHLAKGWPLLVPYDADKNHEPCIRSGHSAHWAIITGFCLVIKEESDSASTGWIDVETIKSEYDAHSFYQDESNHSKYLILQPSLNNPPKSLDPLIDCAEKILLFARQGKSSRVALWSLAQLNLSNNSLEEVDHKRLNPQEYVIPEDGRLRKTLCGKFVLLKPRRLPYHHLNSSPVQSSPDSTRNSPDQGQSDGDRRDLDSSRDSSDSWE